MRWTNPGLVKAKNYDAVHFTTDSGIRIRRFLHPLIHMGIRIAVDRPINVIRYYKCFHARNVVSDR